MNGHTDLHIFTYVVMNAEIYRNAVLYTFVKLFRNIISDNFLLMDDNAHRTVLH